MWTVTCGAWHGARCSTRWAGSFFTWPAPSPHVFRCLRLLHQPHGGDGSDYWSVFCLGTRTHHRHHYAPQLAWNLMIQHYAIETNWETGDLFRTRRCPVVQCVQVSHYCSRVDVIVFGVKCADILFLVALQVWFLKSLNVVPNVVPSFFFSGAWWSACTVWNRWELWTRWANSFAFRYSHAPSLLLIQISHIFPFYLFFFLFFWL